MAGAKDKVISSASLNRHGHGIGHAQWQIIGSSRGDFPGGEGSKTETKSCREGQWVERTGGGKEAAGTGMGSFMERGGTALSGASMETSRTDRADSVRPRLNS